MGKASSLPRPWGLLALAWNLRFAEMEIGRGFQTPASGGLLLASRQLPALPRQPRLARSCVLSLLPRDTSSGSRQQSLLRLGYRDDSQERGALGETWRQTREQEGPGPSPTQVSLALGWVARSPQVCVPSGPVSPVPPPWAQKARTHRPRRGAETGALPLSGECSYRSLEGSPAPHPSTMEK